MPLTDIVAVPTLACLPRRLPEIVEVPGSVRRCKVFMITNRRARPIFETPPAWLIALCILLDSTRLVSIITKGEHRPWNILDQFSSGFVGVIFTGGNIPRPDQHWIIRWFHRRLARTQQTCTQHPGT